MAASTQSSLLQSPPLELQLPGLLTLESRPRRGLLCRPLQAVTQRPEALMRSPEIVVRQPEAVTPRQQWPDSLRQR